MLICLSGWMKRVLIGATVFEAALRSMKPVCQHLRVGGRCVSAIPVMTTQGIKDVFTTDRVNREVFEYFVCECIPPIILPSDRNNP